VAPPLLPERWDGIETATISYGHGLALAPLQFAAAAAILVNGGRRVAPTYLRRDGEPGQGEVVLKPETSAAIRELMRLNVTMAHGTGRRAEVAGYRVGGKTGTAEMPGVGGYREKSVISSFVGAFPMDEPRYLVLVSLFEPQSGEGTSGGITAGLNAAPVTGAIVTRIAPVLGILPRGIPVAP
jgi:cell division protein FtsI (penicillin-binding protein 3)